jgi:Effector Associated Constant Component 1
MAEPTLDLNISLHDDVDGEELDRLTRQMRNELAELDVDTVKLAPGTDLPAGAKGDPITIGSIIVALTSAGVFTGLVEVLKAWVSRRDGRTVKFKAKVQGQEVEMTYSQASTSPQEMGQFVSAVVGKLQKKPARP